MSPPVALTLFFIILGLFFVAGIPVSFSLGLASIIGVLAFWGAEGLFTIAASAYAKMANFTFIAIPLFVFMAFLLQYAGIAEGLYQCIYRIMGRVRGGLAAGTIGIAAIFSAMVGTSTVATALIGTMSIPSMLEKGYAKTLAVGSVASGGALGILIPPSVIMIMYGVEAEESIGQLFMGGLLPGILLSALFIAYILIRCYLRPDDGPASKEIFTFYEKIVSLKSVVLPALLICVVLGIIYTGIATPTESAGIGVVGAMVCLLQGRKFTWENVSNAMKASIRLCGMILWIIIGAACFNRLAAVSGVATWLSSATQGMDINPWIVLVGMQLTFFALGMIMDPAGIIMITTPIFVPIIKALGFDPLWFGILFTINMEMAYISPPFGFNLFVIRGIVPENVSTVDIYRSMIPFILIVIFCLAIVMAFPQLVLWLPSTMTLK